MSAGSIPADRQGRIAAALDGVLEALRFAAREAAGAHADPARWRWVALGLTSALQGALVAALCGYETAQPSDIQNPSQPERLAPVGLLLRRAMSADFLNPPERVELSRSALRRIERVIELRHAAVHALSIDMPADPGADARELAALVRFLLLAHPSFSPEQHAGRLAPIEAALRGLETSLGPSAA